jgi:hypothetical protein
VIDDPNQGICTQAKPPLCEMVQPSYLRVAGFDICSFN